MGASPCAVICTPVTEHSWCADPGCSACCTCMTRLLLSPVPCLQILEEVGSDMKARLRTTDYQSKLHLVDLAGEGACTLLCCLEG